MNKFSNYKYPYLILLFVFAAFSGCSEKINNISGQEPEFKIRVSPAVSFDLSQATSFILTVTGPGIPQPIETPLVLENSLLKCTVLVPAGPTRTFRIEGFGESGELIYSGETITDIEPGETSELTIDLHPSVPMVKLSPMYHYEPFGSPLAFKVYLYNISPVNHIEINLSNHDESSEPGSYYHWSAESVVLNPDIANSNSLVWSNNDDNSITLNINNRYGDNILDESGFRELATVQYGTYFNEGPSVYIFNPKVVGMLDLENNTVNTENIYSESAVAELFYYLNRRVGYWTMNWLSENRNIVIDSSDNNLDGIASGTSMNEGAYGNARVFDGINDFIEVPDNDLLDLNDGITFAFWINIPEYSNYDPSVIFSKMSPGGPVNYQFLVSGLTGEGTSLFLFSYGESSSLETRHTYSALIDQNVIGADWQHIIFSYKFGDPSSAVFIFNYERIYGVWAEGTGQTLPQFSDGPLTFGKQLEPESPLYFKGELDDFELYDVSFSYTAISRLFFPRYPQ